MTVMILKELKRNLKWAFLACAAWSACLVSFALNWFFEPTRAFQGYFQWESFDAQAVTVIGFPLVGFLLGLVQTLPESRRDAWAFLVHRSLSRGRTFWSKTVAGLLLYLAALLVPLTVLLAWLLWPERLALPFEWGMLLPVLSDLATGVLYYFVGILVAMRQARWTGSRLWPLLAAVLVSVLLCLVEGWPEPPGGASYLLGALLILPISATLVLAAYGAFRSGGTRTGQPPVCQWALAASLIAAGCILFGTCWAVAAAKLRPGHEILRSSASKERPEDMRLMQPRVTEDGSAVTVIYRYSLSPAPSQPRAERGDGEFVHGPAGMTEVVVAVLDPSGEPIADSENYAGKPLNDLKGEPLQLMWLTEQYGPVQPVARHLCDRLQRSYVIPVRSWAVREASTGGSGNWFYFPGRGRFYGFTQGDWSGLAYASVPLGSAGPDGFQPPSSNDGPAFPPYASLSGSSDMMRTPNDLWWLATPTEVWWIDFGRKEVRRALSLPEDDPIAAVVNPGGSFRFGAAQLIRETPTSLQADFYVLTQSGRLLFLNQDAGTLADIALAGILGQDKRLQVGRILGGDRYYVQTEREFLEFSPDGAVLARFPLPERPPAERYHAPDPAAEAYLAAAAREGVRRQVWTAVAMVAVPPAGPATMAAATWVEYARAPGSSRGVPPWMHWASLWAFLWPSLASALVSLCLCYWWVRRRSLPRGERIAWLLAALAFGPGVLLALVAFYDSPAKEPCPACGRKRLVTRERCEHCGAPFAPPAPMGIEILEPAD